MDSSDDIVFKKPSLNTQVIDEKIISGEQNESKTTAKEVDNSSPATKTVTTTVLPEPLTQLVPNEDQYFVDQLKNGVILDHMPVQKARLVFGRALDCDVVLEHPSISRYHAVLLWSPANDDQYTSGENIESFWYLVDCGSTHGTTCNKRQIIAGKLIKLIPSNNVFKFGASTRLFSLVSALSDDSDEEEVVQCKTDVKQTAKTRIKAENVDNGCDWGINEAEIEEKSEETVDSKSLQAIIAAMKGTGSDGLQTDNSNAYTSNPNKSIQQWFEREGYELDFKCDSIHKKFKCTVDLPIDGQWIPVEGSLMHKKREAITDACLKCCQLLDKAELLFPWQQQKTQALKRKQDEDDDSDGDMIDETVKISRKSVRKDSESTDSECVDNYETLNQKWSEMNEELRQLRVKLANIGAHSDAQRTRPSAQGSDDSLDSYMASIGQQKYGLTMSDKIEKSKIKMKINVLEKSQQKVEKLIQLAKPSLDFKPIVTQDNEIAVKDVISGDKCEPIVERVSEPKEGIAEKCVEIQRQELVKQKTEKIINELKSVSKPKPKAKFKAQSIVEAIEKEKKLEKSQQKASYDNDYVDWLPPTGQSGDGKTSLNDRFGY